MLAGPITFPPVLSVHVNLVVETVVDRNLGPCGVVNAVHVFAELRPMAISVSVVLSHKQQRVDHLMKQGLNQVFPWSELQERFTKSD